MLLTEGEKLVTTAALQWAAMEHGKRAEAVAKTGQRDLAIRHAAFAGECARIADMFTKGR